MVRRGRSTDSLVETKRILNRPVTRYFVTLLAIALSFVSRLGMVQYLGHDLPSYITFYPVVMLVAMLAGFWPGLLATAASALLAAYWILPPSGLGVNRVEAAGLVLFCVMGASMAAVAGAYRKTRQRAAAYAQQLALRQSQEDLQRTEERWAITLRSIGDAVLTTDSQGNITFLNPVAETITGWTNTEAVSQPIVNVFRIINEQTGEPAANIVEAVLRERRTVALANHTALLTKAGTAVRIADSAAPITDAQGNVVGVVVVFHDVTERRKIEEALRRSEEHLRVAATAAEVGVWHWTPGTNYVEVSANWRKLFGVSPDADVTFETWRDALHPDDRDRAVQALNAASAEGREFDVEYRVFGPEGSVRWIVDRGHAMYDEKGRAVRMAGVNVDVTERKRAEHQLQRLNRTLRALNKSSQALLHASDEMELLERVCSIVTQDCGYALMWVGYAEEDSNKTVRPVAHVGFEEGYLETLHITWADTERGRGPTGTAIRTGQSCMCKNMLTDATVAPWREEARKRGYASSMAVPLMAEGKAFGVITMYAAEPDAFSGDEVKLMEELAGDLAYGIRTLRLRAAHKEAEQALRASEQRVRLKLESIVSPEGDIGSLELADVIDAPALQVLMEDFHKFADIPMAIIDLQGKVLVGVGWQDVCTKFHRVNSESCKHCIESDVELSAGVPPGEFKLYHCKNHMWDVATPIVVGGKHVGNVFTGQFFFEGETPDLEIFRAQARRFGFDEDAYIAALQTVPRLTREKLSAAMAYFMKMADVISRLSYSNIRLARSLTQREELTKSLRLSEADAKARADELAALMDAVPAITFIAHDPECRVMSGSRLTRQLLRLPEGANASKSASTGEAPNTFRAVKNGRELEPEELPVQVAAATGTEVRNFELTLAFDDGTSRDIMGDAVPLFDAAGRVRGAVGAFVDMTERNRAEEELRRNAERFRIMGEILPYGVWWCNERGGTEYVSQSFCDLLKMKLEEQKDFGWIRRVPPDQIEPMTKKWLHCIETGEDWDSEYDVLGSDGKNHTVLTRGRPVRDAAGNIVGWAGINLNIDDRRHMEQQLEQSLRDVQARAEELQTLMDAVPAAVWIAHDERGDVITGNRTSYDLLKLPFGANVSRTAPESQRPTHFRACRNGVEIPGDQLPVQRAARGETVCNEDFELVFEDGTVRYMAGGATPLFNSEGKPRGSVSVFMDITDRKRAEQALIRSEKLASVGRMAATIAHEINNPLAAVMNTLFIAKTNAGSTEAVQKYLDIADEELRRIAHLTRQSLGFYRESTSPQRVRITDVLHSALDLMKSKSKAKGARIETECDKNAQITGIPGELRQVFTNLLANSLDAIPHGGIVKIRVSECRSEAKNHRVRITVADNGVGIRREFLSRLFEPFFTTKDAAGTGLGLWVSKQIINKHGGDIQVRSRTSGLYGGTTFSVLLQSGTVASSQREQSASAGA